MLKAAQIRSPARRALSFNNDFDSDKDRRDILALPEDSVTSAARHSTLAMILEEENYVLTEDELTFIHEVPDLELIPDDEAVGK